MNPKTMESMVLLGLLGVFHGPKKSSATLELPWEFLNPSRVLVLCFLTRFLLPFQGNKMRLVSTQ